MLIIMLLNIIMILMLKKYTNKINKKTIYIIIGGIIVQIILLVIYRLDLFYLNRVVYYSDAETYWNHTLELINTGTTVGYNSLYYYTGFLLQKTSPFIWAGWNNIFNITCINFSILLVVINFIKEGNKKINRINSFIFFTMYNPFIIYGLMRNLKDSLFMCMTFFVGYLLNRYILSKNKKQKIIIFTLIIAMIYPLISIRPWAFIIPIVALIYIVIYSLYKNKISLKKIFLFLLLIPIFMVLICYVFPAVYINIKLWVPIVFKSFVNRSIVSNILGIFRFVFAPGPFRSFMGHKYFEHYLISGNIMAGIGQLIWWGSIFVMLVTFFKKKFKLEYIKGDSFTLYMLIITIIYTFIYVLQYGGMGELRLKSVFIMYIYSIFFGMYSILPYKSNKKIYNSFMIIMLIAFILITWVGM